MSLQVDTVGLRRAAVALDDAAARYRSAPEPDGRWTEGWLGTVPGGDDICRAVWAWVVQGEQAALLLAAGCGDVAARLRQAVAGFEAAEQASGPIR